MLEKHWEKKSVGRTQKKSGGNTYTTTNVNLISALRKRGRGIHTFVRVIRCQVNINCMLIMHLKLDSSDHTKKPTLLTGRLLTIEVNWVCGTTVGEYANAMEVKIIGHTPKMHFLVDQKYILYL